MPSDGERSGGLTIRTLLIWGTVLIVIIVLGTALLSPPGPPRGTMEISYSDLMQRAAKGEIESVETEREAVHARFTDGSQWLAYVPYGAMPDTVRELRDAGVIVRAVRPRTGPTLGDILLGILPMVLLIGAWFFFMRQMRKGAPPSDPTRM